MEILNIGNRRELLIDDFLTELSGTDAPLVMHRPERREIVMEYDRPWEGDGWSFVTAFRDGDVCRMYYVAADMYNEERTKHQPRHVNICYAESRDGVHWDKPDLGLVEFDGNKHNNILCKQLTAEGPDVFIDENPLCSSDERLKFSNVTWYTSPEGKWYRQLRVLSGSDGVHFSGEKIMLRGERLDSQNTIFYDPNVGKYACYYRGWHEWNGHQIRDIRRSLSSDMETWEEGEDLSYSDKHGEMQMYTNGILPYYRAPHIYIGTPARYTDRSGEWTPNYDHLCGAELRKIRMPIIKRSGLATTDGILMVSRDGLHFDRFAEAFLRPGPESRLNWTYGNGYASHGFVPTRGLWDDEDTELSLYTTVGHWTMEPLRVVRYAMRTDGFCSRKGDYDGKRYITKPFLFDGDKLYVNFSTSGVGYIRITLEDAEGHPVEGFDSGILFGDSIDRPVDFPDADLNTLRGKPVRMNVILCDADLFSFRFF